MLQRERGVNNGLGDVGRGPAGQVDQLGHEDATERLQEKQKAGDVPGMSAVIDDDILSRFVVESDWGGAAAAISGRYRGVASRVVLYFGVMDPAAIPRWGEVARAVRG